MSETRFNCGSWWKAAKGYTDYEVPILLSCLLLSVAARRTEMGNGMQIGSFQYWIPLYGPVHRQEISMEYEEIPAYEI